MVGWWSCSQTSFTHACLNLLGPLHGASELQPQKDARGKESCGLVAGASQCIEAGSGELSVTFFRFSGSGAQAGHGKMKASTPKASTRAHVDKLKSRGGDLHAHSALAPAFLR